jgi:hypothetical protein
MMSARPAVLALAALLAACGARHEVPATAAAAGPPQRIVPASAGLLRARTASGDVTIRDGTWGTFRSQTASGGLRLEDCTAEAVELESASGDLVISGGHCRRARIDTSSGDLSVVDGATVDLVGEG